MSVSAYRRPIRDIQALRRLDPHTPTGSALTEAVIGWNPYKLNARTRLGLLCIWMALFASSRHRYHKLFITTRASYITGRACLPIRIRFGSRGQFSLPIYWGNELLALTSLVGPLDFCLLCNPSYCPTVPVQLEVRCITLLCLR